MYDTSTSQLSPMSMGQSGAASTVGLVSASKTDDPLLARLQETFASQRTHELQQKRKQWDSQFASRADKHNELNPTAVELLADETVVLLNELSSLCSSHHLSRGAALVDQVRTLANRQLRESMAYLEDGYRSGFHGLLREADYKSRQRNAAEGGGNVATVGKDHAPAPEGDALLKQCPPEWKAHVKEEVVKETLHQARSTTHKLSGSKALSARETLSVTTSLFAESLASLLFCEVVRIYLYDKNRNLHCVASYPFHAVAGDPMHVTFKEMMIAKELHTMVCGTKIAVNGSQPQYKVLGKRDVQLIEGELKASGLDSLRSCLIFPIIPNTGDRAAYGMIHAVNKVPTGREPASFDTSDEVLMGSSARLLGCMLTRYPVDLFTARVGEAFHRIVFPGEDTHRLDAHLPERLDDAVEDAAEAGNRALASRESMQIFRAPVSDIYQTPLQRVKLRKLGNLAMEDNTLSAVEFNLKSIRELWQSGFDENVVMHRKYRELAEQSSATKLLLQNLLDGLAAARGFQDARSIARYLQTLELLARSESTETLSSFISETLMNGVHVADGTAETSTVATLPPLQRQTALEGSVTDAAVNGQTGAGTSDAVSSTKLFLDDRDAQDLLRSHELRNRKVASRLHIDGPECVRQYSTDPHSKREQVRFIEELNGSVGRARTGTVTVGPPSLNDSSRRAGKPAAAFAGSMSASRGTRTTVSQHSKSRAPPVGGGGARPFHLRAPPPAT